jgi:hypothetical protein
VAGGERSSGLAVVLLQRRRAVCAHGLRRLEPRLFTNVLHIALDADDDNLNARDLCPLRCWRSVLVGRPAQHLRSEVTQPRRYLTGAGSGPLRFRFAENF